MSSIDEHIEADKRVPADPGSERIRLVCTWSVNEYNKGVSHLFIYFTHFILGGNQGRKYKNMEEKLKSEKNK